VVMNEDERSLREEEELRQQTVEAQRRLQAHRDRIARSQRGRGSDRGRGAPRGGTNSRSTSGASRASTSGNSGRGPLSGVSNNTKKGITCAAEGERREYANVQGRMVQRTVNTTTRVGNSERFAAHPHTGGAMGMTPSREIWIMLARPSCRALAPTCSHSP
jgi:hypothetical protein